MSRGVEVWSEKEFVRNKYYTFLGGDEPENVACKEIIDNCIDQISSGFAKEATFKIFDGGRKFISLDSGEGISTKKMVREDTGKESTPLFLSIAKLYSSTNYQGESETIGAHGLGTKLNNFLSRYFCAGNLKNDKIYGYYFNSGELQNTTEDTPIKFDTPYDISLPSGEHKGYYVCVDFDEGIAGFDKEISYDFCYNYIFKRLGCINRPFNLDFCYGDRVHHFTNDPAKSDSEDYVPYWFDIIKEFSKNNRVWEFNIPGVKYFVTIDNKFPSNLYNVCQNAPINNPLYFQASEKVNDTKYNIRLNVAYWIKTDNLEKLGRYSDQTKKSFVRSFDFEGKCREVPEILQYIQDEARRMSTSVKLSQDEFFYPSNNPITAWEYYSHEIDSPAAIRVAQERESCKEVQEYKRINKINKNLSETSDGRTIINLLYNGVEESKWHENVKYLYIVEGCSAASSLRSNRNGSISIFALRGKILNCFDKSFENSVKSDVIKSLLSVLHQDSWDKIIITTDADADGSDITVLILGLLYKHDRGLLKSGLIYNTLAPYYVYTDPISEEVKDWSNKPIPDSKWEQSVNKGLGSYSNSGVNHFIFYPQLGAEWEKILLTKESEEYLSLALISGGMELLYTEDDDLNIVNYLKYVESKGIKERVKSNRFCTELNERKDFV